MKRLCLACTLFAAGYAALVLAAAEIGGKIADHWKEH